MLDDQEPDESAFGDEQSPEDQELLATIARRTRARVLVPLAILLILVVVLGYLGPGDDSAPPTPEPETAAPR